jgi:hypothetical protein
MAGSGEKVKKLSRRARRYARAGDVARAKRMGRRLKRLVEGQ